MGKEKLVYMGKEEANFLDERLPKLKETDPCEFDGIKKMVLFALEKAIKQRMEDNRNALTKPDIFGNLQYAPRAIEKTDGKPLVLDASSALKEGKFSEILFQKFEQVVHSFFTNLEKEIHVFTEEHGNEIKEILEKKGNICWVCTHPSWYGLLIPAFLMGKIDEVVLKDSLISIITAIGPLMVEKEILGMKVNPQDILVALGINVLKTVPHNDEYEKNEYVLNFGNTMRRKFGRVFASLRGQMKGEGGISLIIAPEGTTTPISKEDGVYEIHSIDEETKHLLKICCEIPNTYFVVLGISEENRNRKNDLEPTNITLKAKIISPEELQERKTGRKFVEGVRQDMADSVGGRIQKENLSQHFNNISQ